MSRLSLFPFFSVYLLLSFSLPFSPFHYLFPISLLFFPNILPSRSPPLPHFSFPFFALFSISLLFLLFSPPPSIPSLSSPFPFLSHSSSLSLSLLYASSSPSPFLHHIPSPCLPLNPSPSFLINTELATVAYRPVATGKVSVKWCRVSGKNGLLSCLHILHPSLPLLHFSLVSSSSRIHLSFASLPLRHLSFTSPPAFHFSRVQQEAGKGIQLRGQRVRLIVSYSERVC